jgi:prephenate dehydrogenase
MPPGASATFTRIASSHPEMWRDICLANRDRLLAELERYGDKLQAVAGSSRPATARDSRKCSPEARAARERWIQSS